jgi:hypothetical protein
MVPYFGVIIAANIRTSIGDLQPPGYNYWVAQFLNEEGWARFYIGMIWLVYYTSLIVTVILSLNFLIAIVSQSYESIMDRQEEAIIASQD